MKWLGLTIALLAACLCLVGWIYLRDRNTSTWQLPESQIARADGTATLTALGGPGCRSGCSERLLGRTQPRFWLVRVTVKGQVRCFQIDLDTFTASSQHGLTGVQPHRCVGGGVS